MADTATTTEQDDAAKAEEAHAFDQEFSTLPTDPPPATPAPKVEGEPPPAETPVPPVAEAKFVQVTEDDLKTLHQTTTTLTELKAALDKGLGTAFGKMGSLEQTIKALQEKTPAGQAIALTDEDLAELKEDFPELTTNLIKGLNKALSKVTGTGGAPVGALTPETVTKLITDAVSVAEERIEDRTLGREVAKTHSDWLDVINGPVGVDGFRHGVDAAGKPTAYRQWLATQPPGVQQKMAATRDPADVIHSLDDFKQAQTQPAAPLVNPRSTRLKEAVPPKSSAGAVPAGGQTEDDGFREGLKIGAS